ncbi:thiamine pyrophosphate-binding protein [Helicobacter labetoulli]|uniref:thiamine pyrophosphate-binding protein n=1 Tax=Helicobacter labetoulli TaxID=2315333 RepID=UPI000EF71BDC|nr:thiamine pyrophosphate-binding protein [Helicobacter labetoulli]
MDRVADYVIRKINEIGVEHIFMVTGRGILYLSDAVARNQCVAHISTLHEQGASYAAMAYASLKGVSACLVSTGCASANAITACLCAYQDNLPCIFISGQNLLKETTHYTKQPIRTYGSQEADIISMVQSITKYSKMITHPTEIAYVMEEAIHLATSGRKGPVWIDIPLDIQSAIIDEKSLKHFDSAYIQNAPSENELDLLIENLTKASRPIVLIGGGVKSANAKQEVAEFVEKHRLPLVFSQSACDVYGVSNALSIGAVGTLGCSRAGNFALQNADFVLVIGSKLCSQTIGNDKTVFAREAMVVIVDIDINEHKKHSLKCMKEINCDAKDFLCVLNQREFMLDIEDWVEKTKHWKEIFALKNEVFVKTIKADSRLDLYYLADYLSSLLSEESVVITDAGLEQLIIPSAMRFKANQSCLFPAAQGAMGYAIPAILGAYFAGKQEIVTIVGDGSIMMNIQELATITYHKIPAKIIVINNNMYAVIRNRQKDLFRSRTIGNDTSDGVPNMDFKKIAHSYGFTYMLAKNVEGLESRVKDFLDSKNAVLFEVFCDENQKYLHTSYGFTKEKKLIKKPLEDLSPFIDRDVFLNEMIVKPLE